MSQGLSSSQELVEEEYLSSQMSTATGPYPSAPVFCLKRKKSPHGPHVPKLSHRKAVDRFAQHVDQASTLSNLRGFKERHPPGSHINYSAHHHYKLQSAHGTFHPLHQGLTRSQRCAMMYTMPSIKVKGDQDSFFSFNTGDENNSKHSTSLIIWDSGTSISVVTNDRSYFLSFTTSNSSISEVSGIGQGPKYQVKGEDDVLLYINDTEGIMRALKIKMCVIPDCNARLISTSQLLKAFPRHPGIYPYHY